MSIYEYEKVWSDYAAGRMEAEMALGHTLQHVGKLYEANRTVTTVQRALQEQITALTAEIKALRVEVNRVQKLPELGRFHQFAESLTTFQRAISNLRADVDRLIAYTRLPSSVKGKNKRSKPDD